MLSNVVTITKIMTKYARSNPWFYFLQVIFFPLSLLAPLVLLVDRAYWVDVFIGSAVCSTTIMTIADMSDVISYDKYTNALSFFITRPITMFEYVVGMGLGTLAYNVAGVVTILVIGHFFLSVSLTVVQVVSFFVIIFVGWFISLSLGFVMGMWGPRNPRTNANIASILAYSLTFLLPVYYPLEILPSSVQKVMYLFYTTHLALVGKSVVRGLPVPLLSVLAITLYVGGVLVVVFRVLRWGER